MSELRYPGPKPRYCFSCREIVRQEQEKQRVEKQRERRRRGEVRHRGSSGKKTPPVPAQETQSIAPLPAADWPTRWDEFLPQTGQLLSQIHTILGAQWASQIANQIQAERIRIRALVGQEHAELLTDLFNMGDELNYPRLVDVDVEAGVENWSRFANRASLDQLRAAVLNARRLIRVAQGRRKLAEGL